MAEEQNKLLILIEAQLQELQKGLTETKSQIDELANKTETASGKTEKLGKASKGAAKPIKDLGGLMQEVGGDVGKAGGILSKVSESLAKFGSSLSTMAPAGTAAIIALGAFGAAIAITGIVIYKNRDAILEYVAGINDVTKAFDAAEKQIGTQISRLTQLTEAYQDSNTSQEDKAKIMQALNKEFPAYFKNLKDEEGNLKDIQAAYENQKKAIIGLGIIKALEAKKAPLYAKIAELGLKTELSLIDKIGLALQTVKGSVPVGGLLGDLIVGDGVSDIEAEIEKINKAISGIDTKYNVDLTEKLGLKDLKVPDRLKVSEITGLPTEQDYGRFNKTSKDAFGRIVSSLSESIDGFNGLTTTIEPLPRLINPNQLTADEEEYNAYLERIKLALIDFNEGSANIINQQIASTFIGLGEVIGTALAGAGNFAQNLGKLLLGSLGSVLTQLGMMAIEIGVGILAVKIALKTLNPYVAIAAGVALVALGVFFSQKSQAIGGGMGSSSGGGGGGRSGSTAGSGSASSYSGSRASGSSGSTGGGTYVFEIEGTKLVGVLSRTLNRNKALGGSLSIG